jgi:hypothetical protein
MKGSEALLRAIAAAGGTIEAAQFDVWLGQLVEANLVKTAPGFKYELTEPAKEFLRKKGVNV